MSILSTEARTTGSSQLSPYPMDPLQSSLYLAPSSLAQRYKLVLAVSLWARLIGLLSSRICADGEVLVLAPCYSIHTVGMRQPLDVAFIDRFGQVLASHRELPPARFRKDRRAVAVLERRACSSQQWFEPGQKIMLAANTTSSNDESGIFYV